MSNEKEIQVIESRSRWAKYDVNWFFYRVLFLIYFILKMIVLLFAVCAMFYIMTYTLATIFPSMSCSADAKDMCINVEKIENIMQVFIHHLGLLSGWILYLTDKYYKKNKKHEPSN